MEYTKGEWKVTQIGLDTLIQAFDKTGQLLSFKVASVNGEANARLIASAPDLYEACKVIVKWLDDIPGYVGRQIKFSEAGETAPQVYKQLIQAIAKAEGK